MRDCTFESLQKNSAHAPACHFSQVVGQYLAIVIDSSKSNWHQGEVKLLLKETASPALFSGIYYMGDKDEHGTSFIMSSPNLIKVWIPEGPFGIGREHCLLRAYAERSTRAKSLLESIRSWYLRR